MACFLQAEGQPSPSPLFHGPLGSAAGVAVLPLCPRNRRTKLPLGCGLIYWKGRAPRALPAPPPASFPIWSSGWTRAWQGKGSASPVALLPQSQLLLPAGAPLPLEGDVLRGVSCPSAPGCRVAPHLEPMKAPESEGAPPPVPASLLPACLLLPGAAHRGPYLPCPLRTCPPAPGSPASSARLLGDPSQLTRAQRPPSCH